MLQPQGLIRCCTISVTGRHRGRDPNPLFDTDWYLAHNPDVAAAAINPLAHYLHNGGSEGRNPSPSFDARCYLAQNPNVAAAGTNALVHFQPHGMREGRVAPVATEFPARFSFFRFTGRHRLGYMVKTAAQPDEASSRAAGRQRVHPDRLPATRPPRAKPPNNTAEIIPPAPVGFGERRGGHHRIVAGGLRHLLQRAIGLLQHAISVLVHEGPKAFLVKALEALRARLASPSACPIPDNSKDLPPSRLGPQHRWRDVIETDEQLGESPSPIPGVRSIQIDKLLPSCRRVAEPPNDRRVDVIVPVYRGFHETRRCLESVLATRPSNHVFGRLLLIDDCGPEPELRGYLSKMARQDAVILLTNPANLGFITTGVPTPQASALESYDKALAVRADYAGALYNRGNALRAMCRHQEALESYEKAHWRSGRTMPKRYINAGLRWLPPEQSDLRETETSFEWRRKLIAGTAVVAALGMGALAYSFFTSAGEEPPMHGAEPLQPSNPRVRLRSSRLSACLSQLVSHLPRLLGQRWPAPACSIIAVCRSKSGWPAIAAAASNRTWACTHAE
jgi:hypothetical protein